MSDEAPVHLGTLVPIGAFADCMFPNACECRARGYPKGDHVKCLVPGINATASAVGLEQPYSILDRRAHLEWCKQRALEYLDAGDFPKTFASFVSDLLSMSDKARLKLFVGFVVNDDIQGIRDWIERFE